jgi:hypothetical protein
MHINDIIKCTAYHRKHCISVIITNPSMLHMERLIRRSVRRVYCCLPSSAQSFLVSGPTGTHDQISVHSKTTYMCSEIRPPLRREEGLVFLSRCYICSTVHLLDWSGPVCKLLLAFASTVILGFGPRRDPWPYYFVSRLTFNIFRCCVCR